MVARLILRSLPILTRPASYLRPTILVHGTRTSLGCDCVPPYLKTAPAISNAFPFSTVPARQKKKDKSAKNVAQALEPEVRAEVEELDLEEQVFKKLEEESSKIAARQKEELSGLRRTDPTRFEALYVVMDKQSNARVPLRDVAHVVPRGRALAVTVYEAANVKKVISAIQVADLNVQPVVDAKNPQLVNVPLPPPTKESRAEMAKQAGVIAQKSQDALRAARQKAHKKLQSAKKTIRGDDLRKAEKKMEDIFKQHRTELEKVGEQAKKSIMEG